VNDSLDGGEAAHEQGTAEGVTGQVQDEQRGRGSAQYVCERNSAARQAQAAHECDK
jgi:hypothetical protein